MTIAAAGRESHVVIIAIWACFAVTFAAAMLAVLTPLAIEIEEWLNEVRGETRPEPDAVAGVLAARILKSPAPQRDRLAAAAVDQQPPAVLQALFRRLAAADETAALAVHILSMAAERYQHVDLIVQAARQYSVGLYVEKDYPKAIRLYSDPLVKHFPGVKYYVAEIYLAEDNPARDSRRGLQLLEAAAEEGDPKATKLLSQLRAAAE